MSRDIFLPRNSQGSAMKNLSWNQQEVTPTITNEIQLFKLETHILRVHVNCDGCRRKVKKILRKIEGVYAVEIDAEEEKVTVRGKVESSKLIGKLAKSGKHAELWYDQNEDSDNDASESRRQHHNLSGDEDSDNDASESFGTSSWLQRYNKNEEEEWSPVPVGVGYDQGFYGGGAGLMSSRVPPGYMYQLYPPSSSMNMMPYPRGYGSYLPNGLNMMVGEHRRIHQAGERQNAYPLRASRYWDY